MKSHGSIASFVLTDPPAPVTARAQHPARVLKFGHTQRPQKPKGAKKARPSKPGNVDVAFCKPGRTTAPGGPGGCRCLLACCRNTRGAWLSMRVRNLASLTLRGFVAGSRFAEGLRCVVVANRRLRGHRSP
eukprot:1138770-Prorocentrum_minimum.AAC.1